MRDYDALYLRQPVVWENDRNTIDVAITPGQSSAVGTGGPKFVADLVGRLGFAVPTDSKVIPFRSQRFNDDTKAPDWKDCWPVAWCLLLAYSAEQNVSVIDDLFSVDARDETYRDDLASYNLDNLACRVLADFSDEKKARAAAQRFTNARVGTYPKHWRVEVIAGKFVGDDPKKTLEQGDTILATLRDAGGVVNLRS